MAGNLATTAKATPTKTRSRASGSLAVPELDGSGPVWLQIRRALAGPIVSGEWPPGTRIPTETTLRRSFGISRVTVGKAIQSLANEGLVCRRPRIGTIVATRALERPVFEIWDIPDLVARNGGTYRYQLLECRKLEDDPARREMLGVSSRTPVLWMRCLHVYNNTPFQLEERLINIDAAPDITCQPLDSQGPGRWLLAHVSWTDAEHKVSAREAPEEIASQLQIAPQAACLVIDRRTWNQGAPVTYARLWHPGAAHNLVGHFKPSH